MKLTEEIKKDIEDLTVVLRRSGTYGQIQAFARIVNFLTMMAHKKNCICHDWETDSAWCNWIDCPIEENKQLHPFRDYGCREEKE